MKIDLKAQIKAVGRTKRKQVLFPIITPTKAQETALAAAYMRIVRLWSSNVPRIMRQYALTLKQPGPLTRDRAVDIELEIEEIDQEAEGVFSWFRSFLEKWTSELLVFHTRKLVSELKYSTNVDLSTQLAAPDDGMTTTVEQLLTRNVSLIKSISEQERSAISDIVFRGLQARTPVRDVARQISQATSLARERALRVASDQTVKMSAAFDKERELQLGMISFIWRHSGKMHYRPWHKERDGKRFLWSSAVAKTDAPGYAPFCGCKAQGVLDLEEE